MTPVLIMTIVCAATAAAAALVSGAVAEVVAGMAAPLLAALATWLAVERAWRADPRLVTRVLLLAWAAKIVFFASYVVAMLKGAGLRAEPFVISFTAYFIALHAADAVLLQRLFWSRPIAGGAH